VTAIVVLLGVLVALQACRLIVAVAAEKRQTPAIDAYVGHRLALHIRDGGPSLRGVLADTAPDALTLARAEHLGDQGVVTALEGRQVVPRARIEFFQLLAGDA
jgi:hypothetical protein